MLFLRRSYDIKIDAVAVSSDPVVDDDAEIDISISIAIAFL
jgi:hypothetical protein